MITSILWILIFSTFCKGEKDVLGDCLNECGLDPTFFDQKSFGGWPASFPFVGQLRFTIPGCDFFSNCTAFIIGHNFVISAKHCVDIHPVLLKKHCPLVDLPTIFNNYDEFGNLLADRFQFIALSNVKEFEDTDTFKIKKYHYIIEGRAPLDMLVYELDKSIDFTLDRRAVCLFSSYVPAFGDHLHFAGFGRTFNTDESGVSRWPKKGDNFGTTNYVHRLLLPVQSRQVCYAAIRNHADDNICVGAKGSGLTVGDSGGGAYVHYKGRFFAVGVASEAGVPQYREFDILTGRYIRPDVLVKITPSICQSIKQITHNAVTCMDRLESPTKECVDRITNALEEVQQIDNLYGKIDEQKTKQNQTDGQFIIHTDDENLKRFSNFVQSKQSKTICDVLKLKQCLKFGDCIIHCETADGRCESLENINKSFFEWLRTSIWFNKFCFIQHKQSCGEGHVCNELNECKKSKKYSIFGEW